jgi:PadR family transcriptional regulator, regulatory protein AphA
MKTPTPDETILGLIALHRCHGYELIDSFGDPAQLGRIWKMSTSQIYAVLKRLERQSLITGQRIDSENAPPRTEYHLTAAGLSRLEDWLHEPMPSPSIRRVRVEFLSRIYVARQLGRPVTPIIAAQRAACNNEFSRLKQQYGAEDRQDSTGTLALELMIAQTDAVLRWLDHCAGLIQITDSEIEA